MSRTQTHTHTDTDIPPPLFVSLSLSSRVAGANSIFLRVLLDKKYALPYRVLDALVFHFVRFTHDPREMPVLWHQALLVFVQRYKHDITHEQCDALLELLRHHTRAGLTEEIRREIVHAKPRGLGQGQGDQEMEAMEEY